MYQILGKDLARWHIIAIFVTIAVSLQLIVLFFFMDPHNLFWPDPQENYSIAKDLANGLPYSTPDDEHNLGRAIGYPFFLSLVIGLVGPDLLGVRLVHLIFLPALMILLFHLAQSWKNSEVGLFVLVMSVIYPYYLYVPLTLYPESILLFLFVCIATVMHQSRTQNTIFWKMLLAALIACAVMIRPTAVVWIPVALFYLLWKSNLTFPSIAKTAIPIILIPFIVVAAWMTRNYEVHGSYFFTMKSSEMLLNAYNENSRWDVKHPELPERILKQLAQAKSIKERQDIASNEAKAFIADHPGRALSIALMQMIDLWNPYPRTMIKDGYASTKTKLIPTIPYAVILVLAIIGLIRDRKSIFVQAMVLLLILNTIINGFFMVSVRYRMVTDFVLIMWAASYLEYLRNKYMLKADHTKVS